MFTCSSAISPMGDFMLPLCQDKCFECLLNGFRDSYSIDMPRIFVSVCVIVFTCCHGIEASITQSWHRTQEPYPYPRELTSTDELIRSLAQTPNVHTGSRVKINGAFHLSGITKAQHDTPSPISHTIHITNARAF